MTRTRRSARWQFRTPTAYAASVGLLVASGLTFVAGVTQASAASTNGDKVTICHRTNSNHNPYVKITVSVNAVDGQKKNDHTHHTGPVWNPTLKAQHTKWGDIIPPFDFSGTGGPTGTGQNWDQAGQAIWNHDCKVDTTPAKFKLTKTGTPSGHPGDPVTYTVTLTQKGGSTSGPTTVTDNLPVGLDNGTMTYTSGPGTWTCGVSASSTPSCSTNTILQHGDVDVFSVSTAIAANNLPGNKLVDHATAVSGETGATAQFTTTVLGNPCVSSSVRTSTAIDCPPPVNPPDASITKTGTAAVLTGGQVNYTLDLTMSDNQGDGPTTGDTTVTDTLPSGLTILSISAGNNDAATWTCSNTPSPHCTTSSVLNPGYTHEFTVTATAGNTPGQVENDADVSTPGDSNSENDSDSQDTYIVAPLVLSAECQQQEEVRGESVAITPQVLTGNVLWTINNPSGNPTISNLVVSGANGASDPSPSSVDGGNDSFFTSPGGQSDVSVSGSYGQALLVGSNTVSFEGECSNGSSPPPQQTPASVGFIDTCTGVDTFFTSASDEVTQFNVTTPAGGSDQVSGSGQHSYPADADHSHMSVDFDNHPTVTHDWSQPADCAGPTPGQADPQASAFNKCKTGITVTYDNTGGTADTSFSVTAPDGTVTQVPVAAGHKVTQSFPVGEDKTGVVQVSAPGFSKTFTYAKNCTKVLGEKKTRHPKHHRKPVVQGEKTSRLPFTGFDMQRALFEATACLLVGSLICLLVGRRRRTTV